MSFRNQGLRLNSIQSLHEVFYRLSCLTYQGLFLRHQICVQLGWEGKGGNFDVLPLVLQAHGEDPEMFEIPPEIVLEVEIKHPK